MTRQEAGLELVRAMAAHMQARVAARENPGDPEALRALGRAAEAEGRARRRYVEAATARLAEQITAIRPDAFEDGGEL